MFSIQFWSAAGERAIRTFAQSLIAVMGIDAATSIVDIDWPYGIGVAAAATVLSVLTSIAAARFGNPGPSLASETVVK